MKLLVAGRVFFCNATPTDRDHFSTPAHYVKKHPSYSPTETTRRRLIDRETSAGVLHSCNKPGCVAAANVFIACRRSTNRFLKNRTCASSSISHRVSSTSNCIRILGVCTHVSRVQGTVLLRNRDRADFILMDVPQIHASYPVTSLALHALGIIAEENVKLEYWKYSRIFRGFESLRCIESDRSVSKLQRERDMFDVIRVI